MAPVHYARKEEKGYNSTTVYRRRGVLEGRQNGGRRRCKKGAGWGRRR